AEVLQIGRIGGGGTGLLGVGPGLLVGVLARLLIGRLLLRRLLRIRGLAASRRQGSPGNDGNDRQFRKCDAPSAPGLLTPITAHAWPFFRVYTRASVLSTATYLSASICPEPPPSSENALPSSYSPRPRIPPPAPNPP